MIYIQPLDYNWFPLDYFDIDKEEEIAKAFIKDAKRAISTQRYNFPPLSPNYLAYKRKCGLSLNTWEATSQLKNTLSYTRKGDIIIIGWDKSLIHKNSNLKIYQIAMYLEFGTLNIPPRPLFRSLLKSYQTFDESEYKKRLVKSDIFDSKPKKGNINIFKSIKNAVSSKVKSIFKIFKKR